MVIMSRLDEIKRMALGYLLEKNPGYAPVGYAHLCYSACVGAILAHKRGLDMELCQVAGFLHDVWLHERYPYDEATVKAHAHEGALLARRMLGEQGGFTSDEIDTVAQMIENHDFTTQTDDGMSEIMKDSDMLSHLLNASAAGREHEFNPRAYKTLRELENK